MYFNIAAVPSRWFIVLLQLICGIITTVFVGYFSIRNIDCAAAAAASYQISVEHFFLMISASTLITTFCGVVLATTTTIGSSSSSSSSTVSKTIIIFDFFYQFFAFLLLGLASVTLFTVLLTQDNINFFTLVYIYDNGGKVYKLAAAIIGFMNALFYLCTFILIIYA